MLSKTVWLKIICQLHLILQIILILYAFIKGNKDNII